MKVDCSKGITVEVDLTRLNHAVGQHILYMGLHNILQDSHANCTKDSGDDWMERSIAAVHKKLDSLYAGEVRAIGTRTTDPVARTMRDLARAEIKEAVDARYADDKTKKRWSQYSSEEITAAVNKRLEAHDARLRKTAEKMVKAAKAEKVELTDVEI